MLSILASALLLFPAPQESLDSWPQETERVWLGPELWANRLQDWRVSGGWIECVDGRSPWRTAHLLTRRIDGSAGSAGELRMRVTPGATPPSEDSIAGWLVGAGTPDLDHRGAALIFRGRGQHGGLVAGLDGSGRLVLRLEGEGGATTTPPRALPRDGWTVRVDSEEPGHEGRLAIDGDPDTHWHTEWRTNKPPHPHEIVVDMGASHPIDGLLLTPRKGNATGRIGRYTVYTSNGEGEWGSPVAQGELSDSPADQRISLSPHPARYVRLVAHSGVTDRPPTTLAELYVLRAGEGEAGAQEEAAATIAGGLRELELRLRVPGRGRRPRHPRAQRPRHRPWRDPCAPLPGRRAGPGPLRQPGDRLAPGLGRELPLSRTCAPTGRASCTTTSAPPVRSCAPSTPSRGGC